jgi:hypothetical protein
VSVVTALLFPIACICMNVSYLKSSTGPRSKVQISPFTVDQVCKATLVPSLPHPTPPAQAPSPQITTHVPDAHRHRGPIRSPLRQTAGDWLWRAVTQCTHGWGWSCVASLWSRVTRDGSHPRERESKGKGPVSKDGKVARELI